MSRLFMERDIAQLPLFDFRRGQRATEVRIDLDEDRVLMLDCNEGLPGELEFRVYCELMLMASQQRDGDTFPRRLSFRVGQLGQQLGMSGGGRTHTMLHEALRRLHRTHIVYTGKRLLGGDQDITRRQFTLLAEITDRRTLSRDGGLYRVTLADFLVQNMNRHYWLYVQESVFRRIQQASAQSLYFKLVPGLEATRRKRVFSKRYADLAASWMRFQVETSPSLVKKQLRRPLDRLVEAGVLTDWALRPGRAHQALIVDFYHGGPAVKPRQASVDTTKTPSATPGPSRLGEPFASEPLESLELRYPDAFRQAVTNAVGRLGSPLRERSIRIRLARLVSESGAETF